MTDDDDDKLPAPPAQRTSNGWNSPLWEDRDPDCDDDTPFDHEFGDINDGMK